MDWTKVKFEGSDSLDRLHHIRTLCTASDTKIEGVLLIGGVDSLHTQTSQAVLKYLFLGSSGQELLGEQVMPKEYEGLEDVILLICPQRISIFYATESNAAVKKILPVISKWRHVTEYVVHDAMNIDEQEECKIRAFKSMMVGLKCVGVPFGVDQHGTNIQDTMVFEKWPLVQSYGLEGGESRGHGFITKSHKVVNLSREMMQIMAQLDIFSAKRLVQESLPFLKHHFNTFLQKLDQAESPHVRNSKSECDLGEDLLSSYEFGMVQHSAQGLDMTPSRGSRVLFGVRTSVLREKSSSKAFLANSGVKKGLSATHMVVQAEDPFTGLRFARTYFLSSGKVCSQLVDEDALVTSPCQIDEDVPKSTRDTKRLIDLYALLVCGFKTGAAQLIRLCREGCGESLDQFLEAARAKAIDTMVQIDQEESKLLQSLKLPSQFLHDRLHVTAELMDARGQCINSLLKDWCLLSCSMTLANIPSDANSALSLGSLVLQDTFLFRSLGSCSVSALATKQVLKITKPFAYFRSWVQNGEEATAVDVVMRTLQSTFILHSPSVRLGKQLVVSRFDSEGLSELSSIPTKATLLLNSDLLPLVHGRWRIFTGGFVFSCPNFNPLIVSIERNVASFSIDPTPYEQLMLLKIVLKHDEHSPLTPLSAVLPILLNSDELFIPLQSNARFQKEVLQALKSWKVTAAAQHIPFAEASISNQQARGDTPRDRANADYDLPHRLKATCAMLVFNQSFVRQDARTLHEFFPPDFMFKNPSVDTSLLEPPAAALDRLCIPITVMIGIPGSGVQALSELVCKFSSSSYAWVSLSVDLRDLDLMKQQKMEMYGFYVISAKLARALNEMSASTQILLLPRRILISITGYVDPITVACAVRRGAHHASLPSKIGAIITCISVTNIYLPDPLATQAPFPKVFDQMTAGFVTHSVVTNSAYVSGAVLQHVRYRMDQVNPFADVMVLSHDVFEGPLNPLLAVDRFERAEYKQYRSFHFQDWDKTVESNEASRSYTCYVAELDPNYSPVTFRIQIAPGMDRLTFLHLVTNSLTPFATMAKSMDRLHSMAGKHMKGLRIAQAIACNKVRQGVQDLSCLSTVSCIDGVDSSWPSCLCWCVEGQVAFNDEPNRVYDYRSTGTLARLWVDPNHARTTTDFLSMELKVTGQGLDADKLRQLFLNCYHHANPSPNQGVCSTASIGLEEKRGIQRQHATDPLPKGFLFDGTSYVDFFGGRYEFHPCIAQFIDEYITAANNDQNATNATASTELENQQWSVQQLV